MSGWLTAAGFAELGSEVWCVEHRRSEDRAPAPPMPICGRGSPSCSRRNAERACASRRTCPTRSSARACCSSPSARRRRTRGDADLSAVNAVIGAMPACNDHALVMKSTVPAAPGVAVKRIFRRAGQGGGALRFLPGVPQGGLGGQGFLHAPRPRRHRRSRRLGGRRRRRALRAARARRSCAPTSRAPRWSSSPRTRSSASETPFINEIANVCEETRRRRRRGRARDGARRSHRPEVPPGGVPLRGFVLRAEETVLARVHGATTLLTLSSCGDELPPEADRLDEDALRAFGAAPQPTCASRESEKQYVAFPVRASTRRIASAAGRDKHQHECEEMTRKTLGSHRVILPQEYSGWWRLFCRYINTKIAFNCDGEGKFLPHR